MSIHSVKPETEALVRRQRRQSFVSSVVIGLLGVLLLLLLLSFLMLVPLFKESPTLVTYQAPSPEPEPVVETKSIPQSRSKPPSSSSALSRVIAANISSPTAVPTMDVVAEATTDGFGMGDDFGDGWDGGGGDGKGGGATFFQQRVRADRVAYVIDFSQSMKGKREELMRAELKKSIEGLPAGMSYQTLFFAGPTWVAGSEVMMAKGKGSATVKTGSVTYDWTGGKAHDWEPRGKKCQPVWIQSSPTERSKSLKLVVETGLVWGTAWEPALEMALAMNPPPQVIFFMTDGMTGGDMLALARKIGGKAAKQNTVINTVAMMEPKAELAMKEVAKQTGGQFTVIEKDGKVRMVPVE